MPTFSVAIDGTLAAAQPTQLFHCIDKDSVFFHPAIYLHFDSEVSSKID